MIFNRYGLMIFNPLLNLSKLSVIVDFTKSLGIPDKMNKLKQIFGFKMSDITLKTVFDLMDNLGLDDTKQKIQDILKTIEVFVYLLVYIAHS